MKLLLENWREYLVEGAKTADDLPDGVVIVAYDDDTSVTIVYGNADADHRSYTASVENSPIKGEIHIGKIANPPCGDAWRVGLSTADDGWGPLLYDVAMEWASRYGGGLIPDRVSVSKEARKVWKYYLNNRSNVQAHQLDDEDNTLTPGDEDNCNQRVARKSTVPFIGGYLTRDFASESNPMSKRYTKEPDTIRRLVDIGKFIQI